MEHMQIFRRPKIVHYFEISMEFNYVVDSLKIDLTMLGSFHIAIQHFYNFREPTNFGAYFSRDKMCFADTRILTNMGQSPWDDIKILGHCSVSVCQYVCLCVLNGTISKFWAVPCSSKCVYLKTFLADVGRWDHQWKVLFDENGNPD